MGMVAGKKSKRSRNHSNLLQATLTFSRRRGSIVAPAINEWRGIFQRNHRGRQRRSAIGRERPLLVFMEEQF